MKKYNHLISVDKRQQILVFKAMDLTKLSTGDLLVLGAKTALEKARPPDNLKSFIEKHCLIDPDGFIPVSEFKKELSSRLKCNFSQKELSKEMRFKGFKVERPTIDGVQIRCWHGLKWKITQ